MIHSPTTAPDALLLKERLKERLKEPEPRDGLLAARSSCMDLIYFTCNDSFCKKLFLSNSHQHN